MNLVATSEDDFVSVPHEDGYRMILTKKQARRLAGGGKIKRDNFNNLMIVGGDPTCETYPNGTLPLSKKEIRRLRKWVNSLPILNTIIAAAILASVTGGYAHAQVPVTDSGSIAQEVISVGQQAKQYVLQGQQYMNELQQTAQMVQTYYAFVQNPSLGAAAGIIGQAGLSNDLPINPSALSGLTSGYSMSLSGLSGKMAALGSLANASYDQNHVYTCTDQSWACQQQQQRAYGIAGSEGIAQSAYQDLRNHMPVVQALQDRAATATTPAEREEVSNALQAESVWNQNTVAQIQAAQMQAAADKDNLIQRDNEELSKNINDTLASIPGN